ncbi:thermonuclease family protein [Bacillus sp. REN3]|uniref:thermonuclease family protein n=1 Tax=Bacillus sp. REN3 TaxID=2802440 RepID=UPI001FEF9ECD|nr:thermonuclease family protein [Bacillus sp. REN3]
MKHLKVIIVIISIVFFFFPAITSAHNGARDELGGHFRNADCMYFLHEPTEITNGATNMQQLIELIKQYNNNSRCTAGLTEAKVGLEGYTFSSERSSESTIRTTFSGKKPSSKKLQLGKSYPANLVDCTDGDTAVFNLNGKNYKTRFLYIDTPESTREIEPFGPEAAEFTCSFLQKGPITLETDGGNLFDRYDRLLAWVWVGDQLHQEEITKAGLVEGYYDYGSYKYENRIGSAMEYAKANGNGIYGMTEYGQPEEAEPETQQEEVAKKQPFPKSKEPARYRKNEESEYYSLLTGLISAVLFYFIGPIKEAMGKRTLLARRMWSRKGWLNILLGIIYTFICPFIILLLIVEVLHIFKKSTKE